MENSKPGDRSLVNLKLIQLVHASTSACNNKLLKKKTLIQHIQQTAIICVITLLNHHFIKSNQIYYVEKLTENELYVISLQHETTPTSQKYFERMFQDFTLQWK